MSNTKDSVTDNRSVPIPIPTPITRARRLSRASAGGPIRGLRVVVSWVVGIVSVGGATGFAQHQTDTLSPVTIGGVPYEIVVTPYDFGSAQLPTLHSFAAGEYDGKWVMIAGRTNGLHGFGSIGSQNFPESFQNREVWVVDPVAKQSWHRSLEDDASSGLTDAQVSSLTPANNQFTQIRDRLYMTGGYGTTATGGFDTFDTLSGIDLPGIVDWVVTGSGSAADHIRQVSDDAFRVTGGAMAEMNGRVQLVFGHDFRGGYVPGKTGTYTKQVRSFEIVDDGTTLGFTHLTATDPREEYRRRDLNVYPVIRPNSDGTTDEGLVVLSGVFTESFGAWTVPVEIDESGTASMSDPLDPGTFKQGINNYHSAKLGLYSQTTGQMHEVLFGGITLNYYDPDTEAFVQDDDLPFSNEITSVVIDADGNYTQHLLGAFPVITDQDGNPLRFGANAEFFPADGIDRYENGVLDLDALTDPTTLGYLFGGIVSNAPHTRGVEGAISGASDMIFEVRLVPVLLHLPQPGSGITLTLAGIGAVVSRRRVSI